MEHDGGPVMVVACDHVMAVMVVCGMMVVANPT